jgi:hemoglobin
MRLLKSGLILSLALALVGCDHDEKPAPSKSPTAIKSLYERLGGEPAIKAVVDDFVPRAAADPKVNFTRKGTPKEWQATAENVDKLKRGLVQFIAMATGGPQKYQGRPMKPLHAGMMITSAEFDALAADLIASLNKLNVPARERDELIAVVATTKADIVEVK